MRGRKPKLTFSETVKLRSIQAAFGIGSKEEEAFWENVKKAAKLRREIRRGSVPSSRPRKKEKICYIRRGAPCGRPGLLRAQPRENPGEEKIRLLQEKGINGCKKR